MSDAVLDLSPAKAEAVDAAAQAVPLTLLTGFLGAGKTTLLNRILNGDHGLRVAVLVNDFGAINIDAELVLGIKDDVVSLANGCICCTVRDDLVAAVLGVLERPERPEYILLEASGVADPAGVVLAFADEDLQQRIRLDAVLCLVDAEQVFAAPEAMDLKLRQIAYADMVILNKVDLVQSVQIARIKSWLDDRFHRYRLIESRHAEVPLDILFSVGRLAPALQHRCDDPDCDHGHHDHHHGHDHDHADAFGTWHFETEWPLVGDQLLEVMKKLPSAIYRAKGIVTLAEAPERQAVLQVVGRRASLTMGEAWGDRPRQSRIVFIGARGAYDETTLEASLGSAIARMART